MLQIDFRINFATGRYISDSHLRELTLGICCESCSLRVGAEVCQLVDETHRRNMVLVCASFVGISSTPVHETRYRWHFVTTVEHTVVRVVH
jgi:hypothetical protein